MSTGQERLCLGVVEWRGTKWLVAQWVIERRDQRDGDAQGDGCAASARRVSKRLRERSCGARTGQGNGNGNEVSHDRHFRVPSSPRRRAKKSVLYTAAASSKKRHGYSRLLNESLAGCSTASQRCWLRSAYCYTARAGGIHYVLVQCAHLSCPLTDPGGAKSENT